MDIFDVSLKEMRGMYPAQMNGFDNTLLLLAENIRQVKIAVAQNLQQRASTGESTKELVVQLNVMDDISEYLAKLSPDRMTMPQMPIQPATTPEEIGNALYSKQEPIIPATSGEASIALKKAMGDDIAWTGDDNFRNLDELEGITDNAPAPMEEFPADSAPASFTFAGEKHDFRNYGDVVHTVISKIFKYKPNAVIQYVQSLSKDSPFRKFLLFDTAEAVSAIAVGKGLFIDLPKISKTDCDALLADIFRAMSIRSEQFAYDYKE